MKSNILKYFILPLSVLVILIVYFSTIGIETDKFNDQIKKRISLINKKIDVDLKKIKLILDPFKLKIYAKTVGTTVYLSKRPLALESIKTQVSLSSLLKNKISSSNIEVKTKSILLNDLIKFIRTTNNKPQLFILEKVVKKGHVIIDLTLNIDENGKIKNDYEIKKREEENQNVESSKSEIGWGHQIRSYVLQPYRLVKDNRTSFESTSPDKVLDGDIDEFLEQSLYKLNEK